MVLNSEKNNIIFFQCLLYEHASSTVFVIWVFNSTYCKPDVREERIKNNIIISCEEVAAEIVNKAMREMYMNAS